MTTMKVYIRISETKIIERIIPSTIAKIKEVFVRYAKSYKLAYGYYPNDDSLSIEAKEYNGVSVEMLRKWVKELKQLQRAVAGICPQQDQTERFGNRDSRRDGIFNMKKKKGTRGGAGRNQGRKLKYGEETVKLNYRVPISFKPILDKYVSDNLSKYEKAAKGST